MRPIAACSLVAWCVGCAQIAGIDDWAARDAPGGTGLQPGQGGGSSSSSSAGGMAGTSSGPGGGGDGPTPTRCELMPDCSNPDCIAEGFACLSAPAGWQGPAAFWTGPAGEEPSCPAAFSLTAFGGGSVPKQEPTMCSACTCDPSGLSCKLGDIVFSLGATCSVTANDTQSGGCELMNASAQSFKVENPSAMGVCTQNGGMPMPPPPTFAEVGWVCASPTPGSGCGAGASCIPDAAAPFVGLCVWATGDLACPGDFPSKTLLAIDFVDGRSCTACACGNAKCNAVTNIYPSGGCMGNPLVVPNDGSCYPGKSGPSRDATTMLGCPPTGGLPTGALDLGPTRTTVCCGE